MADEDPKKQTFKEKLLFYVTAFFVLLGTFSLFSFLFLVPFVIDPAFTTIFMEFDEEAATCVTNETIVRQGASNCSWTSCREGCTREIYNCTQIRVNYKRPSLSEDNGTEWFIERAKLYPNVKGCGYPPMLNCSKFLSMYREIGTNFSCYYSKEDPGLVISNLDMWQVYMNLVYAMAIPIPSFILSVIYLTYAYFKIYNDDEETEPLEKNAEAMDMEGESVPDATQIQPNSGGITPASEAFREDLASFGHHFKVAMADEMSRESLNEGMPNSVSITW